jgi:segregation and condensation protein B
MRLEAVLLLAKSPLSVRKLAQLAHLADATEARTLVRQLNRVYEERRRAIRIEQVAGGYRMLTRPALAPWLTRLGHVPSPIRLSTPMMETLAVVAYRQPVSRASAEAVRGVACGELLRQLMERDLVRIVGRSEELGRPYLYGTTKRFLKLFGLPHEDALPPIQWQTLQEMPNQEDSPQDDLSTSTKEPVVSITVAPVLNETDPELAGLVTALAFPTDPSVDPYSPRAESDDDEDELFEEEGDDEEDEEEVDDWDEDDDDEDWEDDDLEGDDEEDEVEEDEAPWEEVDDVDADVEDESEEGDEESEEEDDDEDEEWEEEDEEDEDWDDDDDAEEEEDEDDDDWD